MQQSPLTDPFVEITPTAPVETGLHGERAKCLQRLIRLDLPVPRTVALPFETVRKIAHGQLPDIKGLLNLFKGERLLTIRPSPGNADWGGPGAVLNLGMSVPLFERMIEDIGMEKAATLYLRFIQAFAVDVAHLDPEVFDTGDGVPGPAMVDAQKRAYEEETDEPFPETADAQLSAVLRSMARAWEGTSARLLRQANGAPEDAGLGLVVQEMALGIGNGESGSGVIQFADPNTGAAQITGRYLSQSQGRDAVTGGKESLYLTRDPRGASLEELAPEAYEALVHMGDVCRSRLREEMQIEFTIEAGRLAVLDAVRIQRSARATVSIAVALARDGIISKEDALLRVEPTILNELLHRRINPDAQRDVFTTGIAASPGAATGRLVFSAREVQAMAARDEHSILVRRETSPEDVRGMHAAAGILTERGGATSHAAVIARGLGLPCVVGAEFKLDRRNETLTTPGGRVLRSGDIVTLDGSAGEVLSGATALLEPAPGDGFRTLMNWADEARDIGVRANADTPEEAKTARAFGASGIGLCRTEHMFFDAGRLTVMREMIFADSTDDRDAALARLLPMQRDDFIRIFEIMEGQPVCIRLLDPPLHEFLPSEREAQRDLAEALGKPVSDISGRVSELSEYNPMLGLRGVRLGIFLPEIYDMQARAIFEATLAVGKTGAIVEPEIMIPLVSAKREVELVKSRIDAVAAAVRTETGKDFDYRMGVMVETPRAALRAHEIATNASFLSFGTNDLTQMTYGLSRDDAGRFMGAYVNQGVFEEDPFHTMDLDGVGELLMLGSDRGREGRPDVVLSICGEHGGDPSAIAFVRKAGFDYVSCSAYRVPLARLAAAHLALKDSLRAP